MKRKTAQVRAEAIKHRVSDKQGFTLVELLVVIAIIAILAAVIVLIINPLELTRRGRDATRLSDMANLQQAINVAVQEATASGNAVLCYPSGTVPCTGTSTATSTTARKNDGSGWIPVNLAAQTSVQVPTLPIDPTNTTGSTGFHYTYCSDGTNYEIDTKLESTQQSPKEGTDGGDDGALYEVGSNLTLIGGQAKCTY